MAGLDCRLGAGREPAPAGDRSRSRALSAGLRNGGYGPGEPRALPGAWPWCRAGHRRCNPGMARSRRFARWGGGGREAGAGGPCRSARAGTPVRRGGGDLRRGARRIRRRRCPRAVGGGRERRPGLALRSGCLLHESVDQRLHDPPGRRHREVGPPLERRLRSAAGDAGPDCRLRPGDAGSPMAVASPAADPARDGARAGSGARGRARRRTQDELLERGSVSRGRRPAGRGRRTGRALWPIRQA